MTEKSPSPVSPFVPPSWLKNGHAMTLYAWAKRRSFPELPAPERRLFKVADDTTVAADCYWQQDRAALPGTNGLRPRRQAAEDRGRDQEDEHIPREEGVAGQLPGPDGRQLTNLRQQHLHFARQFRRRPVEVGFERDKPGLGAIEAVLR